MKYIDRKIDYVPILRFFTVHSIIIHRLPENFLTSNSIEKPWKKQIIKAMNVTKKKREEIRNWEI